MRRSRSSLLLPTVLVMSATVACDTKSPPADAAAVPVVDSVVAVPSDSSAAVPATPTQTTTTTTTVTTTTSAGQSQPSPYLGHDSAFGPTFTVDSTGKVTPIAPTKKKP